MEITVKSGHADTMSCAALLLLIPPATAKADLQIFNLAEKSKHLPAISKLLRLGDFHGNADETAWLHPDEAPAQRVLLAGLGRREGELDKPKDGPHLQRVIANAVAAARKLGVQDICVPLAGALADQFGEREAARLLAEAALLANYQFAKYKSKADPHTQPLQRLLLAVENSRQQAEAAAGVEQGRVIATWTCCARDLQNTPPNDLTPELFAQMAQVKAAEARISCRVFDENMIRELRMGALLAVAQGSSNPPRFVVLENQRPDSADTIVLIGKGVTFDSGGLSLKSPEAMEEMKFDMSGAAAALSATCCLAQLRTPLHLVCLLPLVENMPSGQALRPGDIVRASNGKTIEVADTDAEGRLILADALAYASRFAPQAVIDLATLTGSVFHALGDAAAGLFSNDSVLRDRIKQAAQTSGERVWELPLFPEFSQHLDSEIADVRNISAKKTGAGASHGAAFLAAFVNGCKWAHLDIAAVAFPQETTPLCPAKGTGWGVRLLTQFCLDWAANKQ